jgi:hypothetical protein
VSRDTRLYGYHNDDETERSIKTVERWLQPVEH